MHASVQRRILKSLKIGNTATSDPPPVDILLSVPLSCTSRMRCVVSEHLKKRILRYSAHASGHFIMVSQNFSTILAHFWRDFEGGVWGLASYLPRPHAPVICFIANPQHHSVPITFLICLTQRSKVLVIYYRKWFIWVCEQQKFPPRPFFCYQVRYHTIFNEKKAVQKRSKVNKFDI